MARSFRGWQRQPNEHLRATLRLGFDNTRAAQLGRALAHRAQAHAGAAFGQ